MDINDDLWEERLIFNEMLDRRRRELEEVSYGFGAFLGGHGEPRDNRTDAEKADDLSREVEFEKRNPRCERCGKGWRLKDLGKCTHCSKYIIPKEAEWTVGLRLFRKLHGVKLEDSVSLITK